MSNQHQPQPQQDPQHSDYWRAYQYPDHQYPAPQGYYPQPYAAPAKQPGTFKRGFGLGAGAGLGAGLTLLVLGLVGTLVSSVLLAGVLGAAGSSTPSTSTVWGDPGATYRLRSIQVNGPIMGNHSDGAALTTGTYGYEVAAMIDELGSSDADGLILEMNTPGGTIYGARAIADAVKRYQDRTGKKVLAFVRGMSASGGMYAMAGADEIVVDHGTLVGSIGVIMGPVSRYKDVTAIHSNLFTQGVTANGGITQEYLTQGKGKDAGNPFRDLDPADKAVMMQGLADEYENFVQHVSQGRGIPAATIKNTLGARMFGAKQAKANKLIDDEMGQEQAYRHAAEMNGVNPDQTRVVQEQAPGLLQSILGADSSRVRGQAPALSREGTNPAAVSSVVCTGKTMVMAYAGDKSSVCG